MKQASLLHRKRKEEAHSDTHQLRGPPSRAPLLRTPPQLCPHQLFLAVCQQPLLITVVSSLCFSLGCACLRSRVLLGGWWPAAATTTAPATATAAVTLLLAILRGKGWEEGKRTQPGAVAQGSILAAARPRHGWIHVALEAKAPLCPVCCPPRTLPLPLVPKLGKDPWKLTWVGLLFLGNLLQAAQQSIDVGLDLRQLCLDGLQLTALYWEHREYRLSPRCWELDTNIKTLLSPILSTRKAGQREECPHPWLLGQQKGWSCPRLLPETFEARPIVTRSFPVISQQ